MDISKARLEKRLEKKKALRRRIVGTPERPRLSVRRTLKHMIAQVIDDAKGISLLQVNSKGMEIAGAKIKIAKELGGMVAERLIEKGISEIVFDRGGYLYHGRIKAVADGAREKGLKF